MTDRETGETRDAAVAGFDDFLKRVQKLDAAGNIVQATAHTSAVVVPDEVVKDEDTKA